MSAEIAGGYILAGGRSRRMGTDKAALPWRGTTLGAWVAGEIAAVTGHVTVVGASWPGYRSIPDRIPDFGPVSGIASCLADTSYEWNVIVACDMPGVSREWLRFLLDSAEGDVLVPRSADGQLHPLCAVWNQRADGPMTKAARKGIHAVRDAIRRLDCRTIAVNDEQRLVNVNTPQEWACVQE